jgi:hypothetical protein
MFDDDTNQEVANPARVDVEMQVKDSKPLIANSVEVLNPAGADAQIALVSADNPNSICGHQLVVTMTVHNSDGTYNVGSYTGTPTGSSGAPVQFHVEVH